MIKNLVSRTILVLGMDAFFQVRKTSLPSVELSFHVFESPRIKAGESKSGNLFEVLRSNVFAEKSWAHKVLDRQPRLVPQEEHSGRQIGLVLVMTVECELRRSHEGFPMLFTTDK